METLPNKFTVDSGRTNFPLHGGIYTFPVRSTKQEKHHDQNFITVWIYFFHNQGIKITYGKAFLQHMVILDN